MGRGMSRLFLFGVLVGLAGVLAGAHFYPWVQHERVAADTRVVANGGRAETFVMRLPVDRIAGIASPDHSADFPAGIGLLGELSGAALSVEQFKVRATDGTVIGVASRHWTETPVGPALAWSLAIPGRGAIMLTAPGEAGRVVDAAHARTDYVAGQAWDGSLEIAAVADRAATRTIASSQEFTDLDLRFTETWTITGIAADGELRGTIVLDTIGRRGS
jgi:hypothetical protein